MAVLVLGADGYLGRNVVRAAVQRDVEVIALVQFPDPPPGWQLPGDAVDRRVFDPLLAGPEGVRDVLRELRPTALINAAGATRGDLVGLVAANVAVVAALVQGIAAATSEVRSPGGSDRGPVCRFVHLGSAAEYAPRPYGELTAVGDPTDPVSPYGVTKLAGTRLVTIAAGAGQIEGTVVRAFNPVGPHAPPVGLAGGAAASLAAAMQGGGRTLEFGSLAAYRDFVDVRDVAELLVTCAVRDVPPPPVVNAGSGRAVLARDLVALLVGISGWEGEIREQGEGSPASAGVDWQQADIDASLALGWAPERDLEQSLADLWATRTEMPRAQ